MVERLKISILFNPNEIKSLTKRSNMRGTWAVFSTWIVIAVCLYALAWSTQLNLWFTIPIWIIAITLIAGRQLALAILMHDASHNTLFASKWANDIVGDWLCARPIWNDLRKYRPYHLTHHLKTSSKADPDLSLIAGFPTTRASLMRKFARDLTGITGLKFLLGRLLMDIGLLKWTLASDVVWLPQTGKRWWHYPYNLFKNSLPTLITNTILAGIFYISGHLWLYAIWVLAYITPFPLLLRIRSLAEHACTQTTQDMFHNTRTTRANWLARALVAPIHVNYHIEHHVMPSVPFFKLPVMHHMLKAHGHVPAPPSYFDVLTLVSSQAPSDAASH